MKIASVIIGILVIALVLVILSGSGPGGNHPDIQEVKKQHEDAVLAMDGVTGMCTFPGRDEIVVMVENQSMADTIPHELDSYPVTVIVSGKLTAQDTLSLYTPVVPPASGRQDRADPSLGTNGSPPAPDGNMIQMDITTSAARITRRGISRPVVGGVSGGPAEFSRKPGTLGLVVSDFTGRELYVLSCAHILAMSDDGIYVPIGTPVRQPGGYRADNATDRIGVLTGYTRISFFFSGSNYADAAIARLEVAGLPGTVLGPSNGTFYTLNGTTTVTRGDTIRKSGLATGVTTGQVLSTDAFVRVFITPDKWALFRDQIVTTHIGDPGDSGAAVDKEGKFVGLYYAGSDTAGVICKAQYILGPLGVTV
jgi:hypothetical protein